jgi:CheY-like chemotaxis protein
MKAQTKVAVSKATHAVILCVDDDDMTLAFLALILKKNGFSVLTANNWRLALKTFRENAIDLVMLDYEMPEMRGHEVAMLIKSLDSEVPIILHSSSSAIPEIAGKVTDGRVPKGVESSVLVAAISKLITTSRVNRMYATRSTPLCP